MCVEHLERQRALKQTQFKKLRKNRQEIKKLASKLVPEKQKQKIVQNGGVY
jgi:hypothetical protein